MIWAEEQILLRGSSMTYAMEHKVNEITVACQTQIFIFLGYFIFLKLKHEIAC